MFTEDERQVMKLAILGATRGVGREFVKQALQLEHEITSIVRSPESYAVQHPKLRVVKGDALDRKSFVNAFVDQDAIVSGLGVRGTSGPLKSFYRDTARNIVEAMQLTNVKRLLCVTSVGVHENKNAPLWYRLVVHPLLDHTYKDMHEMETIIQQTALDWTLIRPARLTDGKKTGKYKLTVNCDLGSPFSISRADVADFMVKTLSKVDYSHKGVDISY